MANEIYKYGSVALLLALIGTWTYFGVAGKQPNYYCEDKQITAYCYDLSSTAKTCYTLPVKQGAKICTSLWKEILFQPKAIQYSCTPINCTKI